MTILDRYFTKRLVTALAKALAALVLVFVLIDLLASRRGDIANYSIPLDVVGTYYLLYIPELVYKYQIAAVAMLVSGLLVLGDAAQNNEILAALSGGVSLRRIIRMPVIVAALFAASLFLLQETAGVAASRRIDDLRDRYFSRNRESKRPGVSWTQLEGGWTCHVMKFNRIALTGENVFMQSIRDDAVEQIQARRIFRDETTGQWLLEDGCWFRFDPEHDWEGPVYRITQRPAPIKETPETLFALDEPPESKSYLTLAGEIRRAAEHGVPVKRHWTKFHAKFSQPALAFVMIWLAIPFALRLRKGGFAISVGLSVAIALTYLILFRATIGLGYIERLPPIVAAWLANAVFLAAGLALYRKTPA